MLTSGVGLQYVANQHGRQLIPRMVHQWPVPAQRGDDVIKRLIVAGRVGQHFRGP
jgi:hypothetical protein